MMVVFRCTVLMLLLQCGAVFAVQEAYQAPLVDRSLLLDIVAKPDGLVAVGERGHIITSSDGNTWQQQPVPTQATLTAVHFVGEKGWAVGHDASILHKSSREEVWQVQMQDPALEKPLLDVYFKDHSNGIAVGAYGLFYRTTDGGKNWVNEQHAELLHPDDFDYLEEIKQDDEAFYLEELASILPHFNRISASGERLYMAGESGLLAYSDDFGRTWQRMDIDYEGSFFDVVQNKQGELIAAGLRGNVFRFDRTTDKWHKIPLETTSSFNSILRLADGSFLVLGNNGYQVKLNGSSSQLTQTDDGQAILNAVDMDNKIIAVTATGVKTLN